MQAQFTVLGEPRGKGRPRVTTNRTTGKSVTYTPEQTVIYENMVRYSYQQQCRGIVLDGAIEACIIGYFPIPKSVSKKRREQMINGKILHTKKIDCDNLAKAVLDSLNRIAYPDDAQIAQLTVQKYYSEQPRIEVILKEIDTYEKEKIPTNV